MKDRNEKKPFLWDRSVRQEALLKYRVGERGGGLAGVGSVS
jgi:hypothetical protein